MKLLFTTGNNWFSNLLRWGLQEPCSHFVVAFDCNDAGTVGTVFQSDLMGTGIVYYGTFRKKNVIVHEVNVPFALEKEDAVYNSLVQRFDGKSYDYGQFFNMVWAVIKHRFFGIPYPKVMPSNNPNKDLCYEVFQHLPPEVVSLSSADWKSFLSPERLYQSLDKDKLARLTN